MAKPGEEVPPACECHCCAAASGLACRMGSRYTQAQRYELEWDNDVFPDREPSHWQEKLPNRRRNVLLVALLGLLALVAVLLYVFRYKMFYGLGGIPVGLWSRDGVLTVGSKTPFHIKVCARMASGWCSTGREKCFKRSRPALTKFWLFPSSRIGCVRTSLRYAGRIVVRPRAAFGMPGGLAYGKHD
jgi:hypothetical protein